MAETKYNRSYWRSIKKLTNPFDAKVLNNAFAEIAETQANLIQEVIPFRFGGLRDSVYWTVNNTGKSVSVTLGVNGELHPTYGGFTMYGGITEYVPPRIDDFTNKELLDYLSVVGNSATPRANEAVRLITSDFQNQLQKRVLDYWDSKG